MNERRSPVQVREAHEWERVFARLHERLAEKERYREALLKIAAGAEFPPSKGRPLGRVEMARIALRALEGRER